MKPLLLAVLLFLAACAGSPQQLQLALANAAALKHVFDHGMGQNEAIFQASGAPQATLDLYMQKQAATRQAFDEAFQVHVAHLSSWAGVDTAETLKLDEQLLQQAKEMK